MKAGMKIGIVSVVIAAIIFAVIAKKILSRKEEEQKCIDEGKIYSTIAKKCVAKAAPVGNS